LGGITPEYINLNANANSFRLPSPPGRHPLVPPPRDPTWISDLRAPCRRLGHRHNLRRGELNGERVRTTGLQHNTVIGHHVRIMTNCAHCLKNCAHCFALCRWSQSALSSPATPRSTSSSRSSVNAVPPTRTCGLE
jgi:hypothetical protein